MSAPIPRPASHTERLLVSVLGVILVFAPLVRGGNHPLALMILELLAVVLLVAVLWTPRAGLVTVPQGVALLGLAVLPLLYLVPVPADWIAWLPGRDRYLELLTLVGDGTLPAMLTLSLDPWATKVAWLALLLPIAIFLAVRALPSDQMLLLVRVLLAVAVGEAVFGLMQFGGGVESGLYLGMTYTHFDSAVGTYTNRNHLAGLMEMVLPIALALLLFSVGRESSDAYSSGRRRHGWRRRLSFLATVRGHTAFVYAAVAVVLLVGVIFSRSRTGIALSALGVLLAVGLFARRVGGGNVYGPVGTLAVVAVGLGVAVGLVPVLDRFSVEGAMGDLRWTMFSGALDGIGAFFPVGSGPGTFPTVFPPFQPIEVGRWFINHVHNDYLEWLFGWGIGAALLVLLLLGMYLVQWIKVWTPAAWSRVRFVQVGAGVGLLLLALHELVDYNLHTPANLIYFAFLAGVFFRDSEQDAPDQRRKAVRRTPRMAMSGQVLPIPDVVTPPVPPRPKTKNPFMD